MFEDISTLAELNAERRRLIQSGASVAEVNSAYNKKKRSLIESGPAFRKPPTFTGKAKTPTNFAPFPFRNEGVSANEIRVINGVVYF